MPPRMVWMTSGEDRDPDTVARFRLGFGLLVLAETWITWYTLKLAFFNE
jgi:hypothetical protein